MSNAKEKARRQRTSTGEVSNPANRPGGDKATTAPQVSQEENNHRELKAVALHALALGFHPVPVGKNKFPIIRWRKYQNTPPTVAEVEAWPWHKAFGVGILTGVGTGHGGIDAVDLDTYKPNYKPWPEDGRELPSDCVVKTGNGGLQYYTAHVPGSTDSESLIAPCVDTRARGGLVVIPPTPGYSFVSGSLETAAHAPAPPAWLAFAIRHPGGRGISGHVIPDDGHANDDQADDDQDAKATPPKPPPTRTPTTRACRTILKSYVRTAAAAPDSNKRNSEFFKAACAVAPHILSGEFNRADVEADFEALLRENEYIQDDGIDAFKRTFQSALDTAAKGEKPIPPYNPKLWTPDDLEAADFPPPEWLIEPLLPASKVIALLGAPKVGKSWLALLWASHIDRSIYIPLEGNTPDRIKERKQKLGISGDNPIILFDPPPPRMPEGLDALAGLLAQLNPRPRAIFIDPWANFKPIIKGNSRAYETDYEHGEAVRRFATDEHVCVIIVHHTRKRITTSSDQTPFEEALGTTGFIGSTDTSIILRRHFTENRGQLLLTSRDVGEYKKDMNFDGALWTLLGEAYYEYADSKERLEIQEVLLDAAAPLSTTEIAREIGKNPAAIRKLVTKMYKAGEVERPKKGYYSLSPSHSGNSGHTSNNANACMEF